ncbi:tudor domain-containing protein 1-like [Centruroides vittatus]|uniref:tudor domain-containing protein 1-like n=1 Tax=Centruroides vittatus TaxID=120091 RepID=UPI00350FBCBF
MKYKHSEDFSVTLVGYPWYHNVKIDHLDQTMISSLENLGIDKELHTEEIYNYSCISSVIETLRVGCEIYLLITMCDGDMFSAMIGEVPVVEEILNLDKCLNDEYSCIDQRINKYKLGDLVAAFSLVDNTWFRACIKKTFKESYLIYYIDYGKEEIVKTVHPLKKKYCSFPSPAIYAKIGSISDDLQTPLRDLILPGNMMKAAVRACIRDRYYLDVMDFEGNEFISQVIAYPWKHGLFEIPDHLSDSAQNENMQQENVYINDENLAENRYKVINSENPAKDEEINNENKSLSESITSAERYENSLVEKIQENLTVTTANKVKIDNMPRETVVPSVVETLHKEDEIHLTIINVSPDKLEFQAINSDQNIVRAMLEMKKSIEKLTIDKNIKPRVGDVIAAQSVTDGIWYRAYILNELNGNFRVRYVDYSKEEEITRFKILPLNLLKVISPLMYCTIEDSAEYIDRGKIKEMLVICKSLLGKVKFVDPDKIHITLLDGENKFLCNVIAFPWHHNLVPSQLTSANCYQKSIQSIAKPAEDLTDIKICSTYEDMKKLRISDIENCEVNISSIVNLCKLFVQPVHLQMEIANLVSEISYFCENNPVTSYVPKINEVVCAKFKDDNLWYRGLVVRSTSLTTFLVHFVDFGNDDEIERKYLRPIPEQFFKNRTYCVEVAIEGLPSILPTFSVQRRLYEETWTLKVIDAENRITKLLNSEGNTLNEFLKN